VVRNLPRELEATVITNSPAIAAALVGHETIEVIMLGGSVSHRVGAVTGAGITDAIRQFRADLCILGACSLSAEMGIGSMYADDAIAKRAMIDVSNRVVAAMLNDKLGSSAPFAVAPLAALDQIVVEADAPDAFLEQLSALPGPQILRAGGESR
jgi:DeoR/GlpR family transcriptional regulator of sugar metabolism